MSDTYYKFLRDDGRSPCAGYNWPLPSGKRPGKWVSVEGKLEECRNGIHACTAANLIEWIDVRLYVIEFAGEVYTAGQKVYGRKARLVSRVDAWNDRAARLFAADCAEHVAHLWVAPEGCDWKPEDTLSVVRRHAEGDATDAELAVAGAVAGAAAGAVAGDAAWAAAWAVVQASAEAAAGAARAVAWAAWASERQWQTARLHAVLGIEGSA